MYVIAGVSGNTGSIVANHLLDQGHPVRVIVRDAAKGEPWRARGAEVAVAALEDTAALTRALAGARGAYLLLPPRPTSHDPQGEQRTVTASLRAAVAAAKVPHVVLLSSIGAQHADGTGPIASLHVAERELAAVTSLTAVRAAYFLQNWAGAVAALPALPTFVPASLRFPQVSVRDIGRVAAQALIEGAGRGTQVIELSGPADISAEQLAATLATITSKDVRAQEAPLDAVVPTFTSFGMSTEVAAQYREMYAGIISGRVDWERGGARAVRGIEPTEDTLRRLV